MDLKELKQELADMTPRSKVFEIVKAELLKRGHWKPQARGKAFAKGKDARRKRL